VDENSGGNNGVLVGFLVGAVVGAVAALLLAPASGTETRRRLRDAADKLADEGRRRYDDARGYAGERADELKEAFRAGKEAYQQARAGHPTDRGSEPSA
jgi:gas vesicle protein